MIRTQVQLSEEQVERLRSLAHKRSTSIASLVREAVDRYLTLQPALSRRELWERASAVIGRYHDTATDVSRRHDDYFAEAIEDW